MAFKPNAAFLATFEQQAGVRAAMVAVGEGVAGVANHIAKPLDPDFEATVKVTTSGVQVVGHGGGINPAAWIEFGNKNLHALAPLRRGGQAMGLHLKAKK